MAGLDERAHVPEEQGEQQLGDADPETGTPDQKRAEIRDSDALGFGIRIGYRF